MPSTSLTWVTKRDDRVCPICVGLSGYTWIFDAKEGVPDILVHPTFGVVWIVGIGSQAHGHEPFGCRCKFKLGADFGDLLQRAETLRDEVANTITHQSMFSGEPYI